MKDLIDDIRPLAESMISLAHQAVAEYAPIVESIIATNSQDSRHIERTLDGLLDFCFDPDALLLYKKLCRHNYFIDPVAAADYVSAYRDLWDSEPEMES